MTEAEFNEYSFTFADILNMMYDYSIRDKYANRPFQFIERIGDNYGKFVATVFDPHWDATIQYWNGDIETGFAHGGMTMLADSRPLRFLDLVGKEPKPPQA